jgi:flagellar basal body-associated protein FliL
MAKFRPAKGRKKTAPTPQGAIPCIVMVVLAIAAVMALLFFVMKSSSSST